MNLIYIFNASIFNRNVCLEHTKVYEKSGNIRGIKFYLNTELQLIIFYFFYLKN